MLARDRVVVVVSKLWIPGFWLCSHLWHVTAAKQRTIVVIKLFATVRWKWCCQPFSYPCLQNVMHCREEICSTFLSEKSMPFVKSKPPLSTRSLRSLRAAVRQQMCSMLASCLQKIELWLWYPSLGLQDIDCDLGCLIRRLLQIDEEL